MITVQVRYTKAAREDPSIMLRLAQAMVLAQSLARRIRERVAQGGDTATPARRYAEEQRAQKQQQALSKAYQRSENALAKHRRSGNVERVAHFQRRLRSLDDAQQNVGDDVRPYVISDDYARALGLTQTKFRSSVAFHDAAGTKPGSFRVSGKMWQSLGTRNVGANAAILDFFGSSIGGARQSTTTKGGRTRARAVQVRNQVKAATVFRSSGVNVIQPKDSENEAMAAAVCRWSQNMLARTLGATVGEFHSTGDQQLLRDILRHFDGSR